ncbi:ergothioneine biosynthesis protein EgtC [Nocardia alba]|uniref:Gamma-glutamyl-hercynylcysteine sulfoxide hydrolase n=1 Tax=Nocardia alba TaxID=225051 RepID=A0A4R1G3X8_9NOCA|nr:ergothioneine biosynthesis protein EgtC [Nocardia alba]TCJ99968.1 glutamine amidotransferase [Nocardia alba]
MCRHLGYVGPSVGVGELVLRGPHSLYAQSWAPGDMRAGGTINADGFGVAWWRRADVGTEGARDAVTRYRNHAPIWTDPAVAEVLGQLESRSVIAAVRSATVGLPVERRACAPFTDDHWAFSHNGVVPEWRTTLVAVLGDLDEIFTAATTPADGALFSSPAVLLEAEALTDSAALWVLLRGLLRAITPAGPITSAAEAIELLVALVARRQPTARLNLLLGNGVALWATTYWHSLSVLVADDYTVLSSEPYDADPRWQSVIDHQLVTATPGHCTITALELSATERVRS